MPYTRAEQLREAIAYALRALKIHGRRGALTEDDRYAIADHAVAELRKNGDPWRLDEELPRFFHGPSHLGS